MPFLVAGGLPLNVGGRSPIPTASKPGDIQQMLDGRLLSLRTIAIEQPWISVGVNLIARQTSRLPWKTFRRRSGGSRERDRTSAAAQALMRPGVSRSQLDLKYAISCGVLIDGNHVEEIYRTPDGRLGLRPLDWRWLTPYTVEGEVVTWEYSPPDGERRMLDWSEVIHYRWRGYDGSPFGVSPLVHLGVTVRNEVAAQQWSEANFRNGTRVGLALLMSEKTKTTQPEREALREEIDSRYVGQQNAGRPMLLSGGIEDVKPIGGQNPVEAALIEQRKVNREEMLAVIGVPATAAGDNEHATYSNVDSNRESIFTQVLPPHLEMMATTTTSQLLRPRDPTEHYTEFDLNDALRGDLETRVRAIREAIESGQITINEGRELENREKYDDPSADQPLIAANNMKPLASVVKQAAKDAVGDGNTE